MLIFTDCMLFFGSLMFILSLALNLRLISKIRCYKERLSAYVTLIETIQNFEDNQKELTQMEIEVECYKFEAESYRESFETVKQSLEELQKKFGLQE